MAWTTPKTWASGYVVLAADLNTHLRDNLNVTAPAVLTTAGDILYASGANTPARLAKSTTSTQYLANTGTSNVPAWNEVALATGVSGTLPVGNGGTGATTFTANGILVGNSTSAVAVTATMATKGHLMAGDGSGVPSMLAVGTNDYVLTADSGEGTGIKWAVGAAGTLGSALENFVEDGLRCVYMLGAPKASAFADGDEVGFGEQWTFSFSGGTGTLAPSTAIRGGWNLTAAAGDGAFAWLTAGDGVLSAADNFTVVYRLNRASAGEAVSFLGIASSANATQATNDIILFQWARGGGSISCVTDNGGSETVTSGVVTVADDTDVTFRIEVTSNGGGIVKFYVDDALEATHTTNIPTSTALYIMVNEVSNSGAITSLHIGDIFAWRTS